MARGVQRSLCRVRSQLCGREWSHTDVVRSLRSVGIALHDGEGALRHGEGALRDGEGVFTFWSTRLCRGVAILHHDQAPRIHIESDEIAEACLRFRPAAVVEHDVAGHK